MLTCKVLTYLKYRESLIYGTQKKQQYCSGFCHTLKWISHGFTCIPHPGPPSHLPLHPIPLGLPSAPGPSTCLMHPTWAGDLFHPWWYTCFDAVLLKHPTLAFSHRVQKSVLYIWIAFKLLIDTCFFFMLPSKSPMYYILRTHLSSEYSPLKCLATGDFWLLLDREVLAGCLILLFCCDSVSFLHKSFSYVLRVFIVDFA